MYLRTGKVCRFEPHVVFPPAAYKMCAFPVCSADSIEANVENADVNVQNATQQLARAADYQVKLDRTERMMNRREERQMHKEGTKERDKERGRGEAFKCINVREVSL